jgi:hypothetical protein
MLFPYWLDPLSKIGATVQLGRCRHTARVLARAPFVANSVLSTLIICRFKTLPTPEGFSKPVPSLAPSYSADAEEFFERDAGQMAPAFAAKTVVRCRQFSVQNRRCSD